MLPTSETSCLVDCAQISFFLKCLPHGLQGLATDTGYTKLSHDNEISPRPTSTFFKIPISVFISLFRNCRLASLFLSGLYSSAVSFLNELWVLTFEWSLALGARELFYLKLQATISLAGINVKLGGASTEEQTKERA